MSNHGGRQLDSTLASAAALAEISDEIGTQAELFVDGGIRRGGDVLKALALGARAVCIGRPYLWGLGAFGQAGVETVLSLLQQETRAAMQQLGVRSLKQIGPALVKRAS